MQDKERLWSILSLVLGAGSLILCFTLGYAGPVLGAAAAAAGFVLAGRIRRRAPSRINKYGQAFSLAGLIVNAVSCLAMLLMLLLGAALTGSAGSFF